MECFSSKGPKEIFSQDFFPRKKCLKNENRLGWKFGAKVQYRYSRTFPQFPLATIWRWPCPGLGKTCPVCPEKAKWLRDPFFCQEKVKNLMMGPLPLPKKKSTPITWATRLDMGKFSRAMSDVREANYVFSSFSKALGKDVRKSIKRMSPKNDRPQYKYRKSGFGHEIGETNIHTFPGFSRHPIPSTIWILGMGPWTAPSSPSVRKQVHKELPHKAGETPNWGRGPCG